MIGVNRYKCGYCGACVSVCPIGAVELVETWIEIADDCTECGTCAGVCPIGAIEVLI